MASYRLFFIGWDKHIVGSDTVDCPCDDDAMEVARRLCCDHKAVEVWQLARMVDQVDAGPES